MIKIYSPKGDLVGIIEPNMPVIEREMNLPPTLLFDVDFESSKLIQLEGLAKTEVGDYVVKEKKKNNMGYSIVCKPDFSSLQSNLVSYDFKTVTAEKMIGDILGANSGWTYNVSGSEKRSLKIDERNKYDSIFAVADTFRYEIFFDVELKKITMRNNIGDNSGKLYIHDEVNLVNLVSTSDSYDIYTRIIPRGKDGLDIASINGGKTYIDNFQYSNKVKPLIWEDERYTVVENLKEDAIKKLLDLSKPHQSFEIDIVNLYKLDNEKWEFLKLEVGDFVDLVSSSDGVDVKQRIVKKIEELDGDGANDKIVIANLSRNFVDENSEDSKLLKEAMKLVEEVIVESSEGLEADYNDKFKAIGDMIKGENGGYKIDRYNELGQAYETLYLDNIDINKAVNVIRLNKSGIAFSTNGIDGPYNTAMTIDGKIAGKYVIVDALETITANLGTVIAGRIQDKDNESYWDLDKKEIVLNVESLKIKSENVATEADVNFTSEKLEGRFRQIGGENLITFSEDFADRLILFEGAKFATDYPKVVEVEEWGAEDALRIRTRADGTSAIKAYINLSSDFAKMRNQPYTISVYAKNNRNDQPVTIGTNRFGSVTLEPSEVKRVVISGSNDLDKILQLQLISRGSGYYLDVTLWHPKWETGWVATDWIEKLYTGITRIDKDGATFGREGETIETNVAYNGMSIKDEKTPIASFGDSGAVMPKATIGELETDDAVLIYGNRSTNTYDVKSGSYESVTEVLEAIFPNNNRVHIIGDPVIKINVLESISDNIVLKGIGGNGRIYFWLGEGVVVNGHIWARDCKCRIYIGSLSNSNRGKIKNTTSGSSDSEARTVWNESSSFLRVANVDVDANGKDYGVSGNDSGVTVLQNVDIVAEKYSIFSTTGHSVRNIGCRGNAQYGLFSHYGGDIFTTGTIPKGSVSNIGNDNGYIVEQGTQTPTDSMFQKPPTVRKTFTTIIKKVKLDTFNYTSGYMATSYYGSNAAQGRYTGMTGWMEGQVTFDKTVPNYWKGAVTKKVEMRLRRKNTSHGGSAPVKPKASNFTASWATGATRGGWTSWGTIPVSAFTEGGNSLFKFRGTVLNSDYAIWDDAEVKVTITKDV